MFYFFFGLFIAVIGIVVCGWIADKVIPFILNIAYQRDNRRKK